MRQDWVVWLGCVLLLCAGAVWGTVPISTDFFKVNDIHDLFEIFSSIATVLAVGLAFIGVNAWRQQVSAEADHALAQRIAVAALKYKETSRTAFGDAQFAVTQFAVGVEGLPEGLLDSVVLPMEQRLQRAQDSKAEFKAVLLECRAIWGDEFSNKYEGLLNLTENFYACLRLFFHWVRMDKQSKAAYVYTRSLQRHYDQFEEKEWLMRTAAQLTEFDRLTEQADIELKSKLLRSN